MATRFTRTCIVCGKEYEYCNGCSRFDHVETWHNIYHDENCRKIFNIASNYHAGKLSREEAAKAFSECDLSNKQDFKPSINKLIDELLEVLEVEEKVEESKDSIEQHQEVMTLEKVVPKKKRVQRAKIDIDEAALNSDFE